MLLLRLVYLRGATVKTFERNRRTMLGTPLLMAPANARCSKGDSLYVTMP